MTQSPGVRVTRGLRWEPILAGKAKERAEDSLDAIAATLATNWPPERLDASLAGGSAGVALLHAYLDRARPGLGYMDAALPYLEHALAAVRGTRMSSSFLEGFPGVAWLLAHLRHVDRDASLPATRPIDQALVDYVRTTPWPGNYDLVSGLIGIGVYGREAVHDELVQHVVERLRELAESVDGGVTWASRADWLPADVRDRYPDRYYNLGVAHGVPGAVPFLACAGDRSMLSGAVSWMLAQKLGSEGSCFPSWVAPGQQPGPARSAWCYGDPGIAATLHVAARVAGEEAWEREAVAVARHAASRPFDETRVADAGFCHGAAGLAHIFNRLYQATGDAALADAARAWIERTLGFQLPSDPGLLMGTAGVALMLLAATTGVEPEWDRALLLSAR